MNAGIPFDLTLVVTTDHLPGYEIVRALGTSEGLAILFETGFTIEGQKQRVMDAMSDAYLDMMRKANEQGAQAIVELLYVLHANHVLVYGTAVTIKQS